LQRKKKANFYRKFLRALVSIFCRKFLGSGTPRAVSGKKGVRMNNDCTDVGTK
jgi:hypothetical protein